MGVLGTIFAFLSGDSVLCLSVVSFKLMLETLGLLFSLLHRQTVPYTACIHRMTDYLQISAAVHVAS